MQEHSKPLCFLSTNSHKNMLKFNISSSSRYNNSFFCSTFKLEAVLRAGFLANSDLCSTFKDMHV